MPTLPPLITNSISLSRSCTQAHLLLKWLHGTGDDFQGIFSIFFEDAIYSIFHLQVTINLDSNIITQEF